jgi:ribosomal protein S18 acetylase RimI-like enzyme
MAQRSIEYTATDITGIELIRSLWSKLNEHHHANARAFRDLYEQWTFDDRKEYFLKVAAEGALHIDLASDPSGRYIGYCVSSISTDKAGEIESVYVEKEYRSQGIGTDLMKRALAWLEKNGPVRIRVSVADGNEEAFPFYRKFGFHLRMTILEQKEK